MDDVPRNTAHLAMLARGIKDALGRQISSRKDWIDATMDLCTRLHEARRQFDAHIDFGLWLKGEQIKIEKNNRSAAIAMAEDRKRLREVLEATDSSSLELIYKNEFRFPIDRKTELGIRRKRKTSQLTDPAEEAIVELAKRGVASTDIASSVGLHGHDRVVRHVIERERVREEERAKIIGDPEIDAAILSKTAQAKLEAAIRQHKKKLDLEFDMRVRLGVREFIEKYTLPNYEERLKKADQIIASSGFMTRWPFSPAEYKQILGALHPDANLSPEKKSDLFQMFKAKETRLKSPVDHEERLAKGGLPRTVDELMERARKAAEARKRKR